MHKKIVLTSNRDYVNDFNEMLRAFSPDIIVAASCDSDATEINITFSEEPVSDCGDTVINITLTVDGEVYSRKIINRTVDALAMKSEEKRQAKLLLYNYLSRLTGKSLPYGSLTGIRPTKLYLETQCSGVDAYNYFVNTLSVSEENAKLIKAIVNNQRGIYIENEEIVDLFVNIPICITRCSYCSFISAEYGKIKKQILPYVHQLVREIHSSCDIIKIEGYKLRAIYVGGGTPTSLSDEEFEEVMNALNGLNASEFTVEAGRPDTINDKKLDAMKKAGVTRISVNPQSFNDKTLQLIGRSHSAEDVTDCYNHIRRHYDFKINMDLIAMLPGESADDFRRSADKCVSLSPDNVTVHTLAIKKGSSLKQNEYDNSSETAEESVMYARKILAANGYIPYYMYRQKYMSGNLDNTGYAKPDSICMYNVDIMEESTSIIACGAGGISKRIFPDEKRIERLANPKGIDVYLLREAKINEDKRKFFHID